MHLNEVYRNDLIKIILEQTFVEGFCKTDISCLSLQKITQPSNTHCTIFEPCISLILQGSKLLYLGQEVYQHSPEKYLLSSTHIPLSAKLLEASQSKPYIALRIHFSLEQIYEVLKEINESTSFQSCKSLTCKGFFMGSLTPELLEPILRLVSLLHVDKSKAKFFSTLIIKEILFILLNGDSGKYLKAFVMKGTMNNKIAKAINEIKENYAETLKIKKLAQQIDMSESSLYHNFKTITSMSPLQFQKKIRLEEAKQMLLKQNIAINEVAFKVGYESPSQFSREYSNLFGYPPKKHILLLKEERAKSPSLMCI